MNILHLIGLLGFIIGGTTLILISILCLIEIYYRIKKYDEETIATIKTMIFCLLVMNLGSTGTILLSTLN